MAMKFPQWFSLNSICEGDCCDYLKELPDECIDLVFADPPFNIGLKYDKYKDNKNKTEYLTWIDKWLVHCVRVLKSNGSIYIAINDEYAAYYKVKLDELGLKLRNWIVWYYTFGTNCKNKFTRSHTHILYYVKDEKNFTFNADSIKVPSARQLVYNDKRAKNGGRLPDDTWILRPQEEINNVGTPTFLRSNEDTWYYPRICGTFEERTDHPCQMPEALLERIIRVSSNPNDLILDPFAGSGTTLVAAKKLGRNYIGMELSEQYITIIESRLDSIN